jgi:transcriptional regulator with XRE-family HTH domain
MLDGGGHETALVASRHALLSSTEPLHVGLGRRLRRLRVERGWSREQVAKRLRVPVAHVKGHERGTRRIEPRDLVAYARLFRVRISDFFIDPPTKGSA